MLSSNDFNDIVYAPFEPRFPDDDQEDEIVLRTV